MTELRADLHLHTLHSDGDASVDQLIEKVLETDIRTIAISDHDTAAALIEAVPKGAAVGLRVIPGIELSAAYKNVDVHLLAYFFDPNHPELLEYCQKFQDERVQRAIKIVEILRGLGAKVTMERLYEIAGTGSMGRPHIAQLLIESGFVSGFQEAFDKYLGDRRPANIPKFKIHPVEAIELIHRVGGVAVLAHPATMNDDSIIAFLATKGLDGLEVFHPRHQLLGCTEFYGNLARKYDLLMTGGSDWHGVRKPDTWIGKAFISLENVDRLESAARSYSA